MSPAAARLAAIARHAMLFPAILPSPLAFSALAFSALAFSLLAGSLLLGSSPAGAQQPSAASSGMPASGGPDGAANVPAAHATRARPVPTARSPLAIVRDVCRDESAAYCAHPDRGQTELTCLTRNLPNLSLSCQSAVLAADSRGSGAHNPVVAKRHQQKLAAARRNCRPDYQLYCIGAVPGGGGILRCLRDNYAELTPTCQAALTALNQG